MSGELCLGTSEWGAKSPLLDYDKFFKKCVKQKQNNFVSSMVIYFEYKYAVELWTQEDNQAKILMKEKSFQRVSLSSVLVYAKIVNIDVSSVIWKRKQSTQIFSPRFDHDKLSDIGRECEKTGLFFIKCG